MNTEFYSLTISHIEKLTRDSVALTFELPEHLKQTFAFIQGQHLTLKADIDGQDIRRSYSICTSVTEQQLTVAVKQIDSGVFSAFANKKLQTGMKLEVMPPQGHFYTELKANQKKNYLLIAAGSGITPSLSHLTSIFAVEPESTATLIYANKSTPLMMFREKIAFIKNRYMQRFNWINIFTREENEAKLFNGRMNGEKLIALDEARLINIQNFNDIFICGPETMIKDLVETLKLQDIPEENIHYELFFAGSANQDAEQKQAQRAEKFGQKIAHVSVKVAGRKTLLNLAMDGDNILDAAMENGADLPYSCKGGVCATCKAKVVKGKVEMDMNHSLTEQEVAEGMILTCQAHPVSDEVEVDFDFS
jgi:ring-1,2-phenylacetyl-CoA epoxidase subunit PaaE